MRKIRLVLFAILAVCMCVSGCTDNYSDDNDVKEYVVGEYEERINAPSEEYIIACLKETPTVLEVESENSESNNPEFAKLNRCVARVYFSSELIEQDEISGDSVLEKGTSCGGSIDIFTSYEQAKDRNNYLAKFDNGVLDSGYHTVVGTLVIRTSDKLSREQQIELTQNIISVITSGEVEIETDIEESTEETTKETTIGAHTHNYLVATCTIPKTCSYCGETEGEALGHSWQDATCKIAKKCSRCDKTEGKPAEHKWEKATCVNPKKCKVCEKTEGEALGHSWTDATCETARICSKCDETDGAPKEHSYSNGSCTACGVSDPNYVSEAMVWIPTNGGTKYHSRSSCSKMKNPIQVTEAEAVSQGYGACSKCY